MRVRPATPADATAMAELYQRSVHGLGSADYSAAQVEAWAAQGPTAEALASLLGDGRMALVAVTGDGRMMGFVDLEPDGHIRFLYIAPDARGTGVADILLDAVEAEAQRIKVRRLYAEASEAARRFLGRRGFVVLHRRDLEVNGVSIHNYAVEKVL